MTDSKQREMVKEARRIKATNPPAWRGTNAPGSACWSVALDSDSRQIFAP